MTTDLLAPDLPTAAARWPARVAVQWGDERLTYAELWERARRVAAGLAGLGVGPGDRVVCQLPNGLDFLATTAAAWALGAVHVGIDRDLTATELAAIAERTGAAAAVWAPPPALPDPEVTVPLLRARCPGIATVAAMPGLGADATLAEVLAGPAAGATGWGRGEECEPDLLLLTSGTTARPKLAVETLPALWAKMAFFAEAYRPGPDDVTLLSLPMAHAFGLKLALTTLATGGRLVLTARFSPDGILRLAGAERATVMPGTPTHFRLLLSRLDPAAHDLAALRWAITAAAPFPPPLAEQVESRLGVAIMQVYGCSEGFLTATTDRDEVLAGSAGRRVFRLAGGGPDGTVRVLRRSGRAASPGETGEIVFGTTAPVRYWGEEPVAADGLYRTGDLGWMDPEGRLHVTGRLKDVVNRGGLKVAAGEVEEALARHPGIAECAVVPVPDPVLGEAICACVVPAGDSPPILEGLRAFLAPVLARFKLPDQLVVLPALPRSETGKLDRRALAAKATDDLRAGV